LNTLCLPFDRRGLRNWGAQSVYVRHLSALFLAFALGLVPQVFMLPHLVYGSVVYEGLSTRQWTPLSMLKLAGDPLVLASAASAPIVGALAVLAMIVAIRRLAQATGVERSGTILLLTVVVVGLLVYVLSGQTVTRISFYLSPALILLPVLELLDSRLLASPAAWRVAASLVVVLCAVGVWSSAMRPPSGRMRELASDSQRTAGDQPIWTSTRDAKSVAFLGFYLPGLSVKDATTDLPDHPSFYLKFEDQAHEHDPILPIVKRRCGLVTQFGNPDDAALYRCPPLAGAVGG